MQNNKQRASRARVLSDAKNAEQLAAASIAPDLQAAPRVSQSRAGDEVHVAKAKKVADSPDDIAADLVDGADILNSAPQIVAEAPAEFAPMADTGLAHGASTATTTAAGTGQAGAAAGAATGAAGATSMSSISLSAWAAAGGVLGAVGLVAGGGAAAVAAAVKTFASGGIIAGPVVAGNDLQVRIYKADGTTLIDSGTVDANGRYVIDLHGHTGAVIARVSSAGTGVADYLDEATGQRVDLDNVLTAVGVATASGLTLSVNPLTTIAAQVAGLAADGTGSVASEAAVTAANEKVAAAFGISGSLIAPASLAAVIDANGHVNASADGYGKVLAILSALDQQNNGDLSIAISQFANDLTANNGELSAVSKFSLVVAAKDPDLVNLISDLGSTIAQLAQIDAGDIREVISTGRSNFTDAELASALSDALGTTTAIDASKIDSIIASIQAAAHVTDLASLAQAAGMYGEVNVGEVLNADEANEVVTLTAHGLGLVAGGTVEVAVAGQSEQFEVMDGTMPNSGNGNMFWVRTNPDGSIAINIDAGAPWDAFAPDGHARFTLTNAAHAEKSVTVSFDVDLIAPTADQLSVSPISGLNSMYATAVQIMAPADWRNVDHWQYRIGDSATWVDGPTFVDSAALLNLPDGTYGIAGSEIHLRAFDDAGNVTQADSQTMFVLDTTTPTLTKHADGTLSLSETGAIVLMNDSLQPANDDDLPQVLVQAMMDGVANYTNVSDADVGQAVSVSTTGLREGTYHFYGIDLAGHVTRLDTDVAVTVPHDTYTLSIAHDVMTLTAPDGNGGTTTTTIDSGASISGSAQMGDVVHITLDNSATTGGDSPTAGGDMPTAGGDSPTAGGDLPIGPGSSGATSSDLSFYLVNFPTIDIDVVSDTTLSYFSSYETTSQDYESQVINIHAGADFTISSTDDYNFDTADSAPVTINVSGSGNVDLGRIDGTYCEMDVDGTAKYGIGITLDAHELTGDLAANILWSSDNTVIGGSGNDLIKVGRGANQLTGGAGDDTFVFNRSTYYNHAYREYWGDNGSYEVITDFGNGNDVFDITSLTSTTYLHADATAAMAGDDLFTSYGAGVNVLTWVDTTAGQEGTYLYIDANADGQFRPLRGDVQIFLQGYTSPLLDTAFVHA